VGVEARGSAEFVDFAWCGFLGGRVFCCIRTERRRRMGASLVLSRFFLYSKYKKQEKDLAGTNGGGRMVSRRAMLICSKWCHSC